MEVAKRNSVSCLISARTVVLRTYKDATANSTLSRRLCISQEGCSLYEATGELAGLMHSPVLQMIDDSGHQTAFFTPAKSRGLTSLKTTLTTPHPRSFLAAEVRFDSLPDNNETTEGGVTILRLSRRSLRAIHLALSARCALAFNWTPH